MGNSTRSDPSPAIPGIGVHSGQVMTVLGPIPVEELGVTLTHEHILSDVGCNGPEPPEASRKALFHKPLTMDILGEVRLLPQCNRDNQRLTDLDLAVSEVDKYSHWGGRTIVEMTLDGVGRDPLGLQMVSRRTGVYIVMGAGYYIGLAHPPQVRGMSADDIADEIVRDLAEGVPGHIVYPAATGGSSILVVVLSVVLLKERPGWAGWLGIGAGLASLVLFGLATAPGNH